MAGLWRISAESDALGIPAMPETVTIATDELGTPHEMSYLTALRLQDALTRRQESLNRKEAFPQPIVQTAAG